MVHTERGRTQERGTHMKWWKSSRSNGSGACVEIGRPDGESSTYVRDTKDRDGGTLGAINGRNWAAFVGVVKSGRFDL